MEQSNHSKNQGSSDRSSGKSRRQTGSEKRGDQDPPGDGGKNRVSASVVRGGAGGKGEHTASDKAIDPQLNKKKSTMLDFQQTAAAATAINSLNSKRSNISPSPPRSNLSSPSPPNNGHLDSSRDLGDKFGYMDFGPTDTIAENSTFTRDRQAAEQRSRATLNAQSQYLMRQAANSGGGQPPHHPDRQDHVPRGHHGGQQQLPEFSGLGPRGDQFGLDPRQLPLQYPDMSGLSSAPNFLLMEMVQKMNSQFIEQNARWQKLQEEKIAQDSNNKPSSAQMAPADASDKSGSDSDEDMEMDWSGQPIEPRSAEIVISEAAMDCWSSLLGLDDKGIQNGTFKSLAKKTKKVKLFIEGKKAMNPQEAEAEIPRMWGWQLKEEEELATTQRIVGGTAVATCVSVDATRATVDDLKASCKDFEDGVFPDPSAEAAKLCAAVADILEEKVIANSIQSLKFTATVFGSLTLKRRALALRQVTDAETKRVLDKTPPNDEYLFGGKVKESVQKSRDSHQMKKVMQPPKRDWKTNKVFKPNYHKNGGGKGALRFSRPMTDRFKGGDKKWRKFEKKKFDKKKAKEDE